MHPWTQPALAAAACAITAALLTLTLPEPAGACSIADPCAQPLTEQTVTGLQLRQLEGPDDAPLPALPADLRVVVDGYGKPLELWLDEDTMLQVGW